MSVLQRMEVPISAVNSKSSFIMCQNFVILLLNSSDTVFDYMLAFSRLTSGIIKGYVQKRTINQCDIINHQEILQSQDNRICKKKPNTTFGEGLYDRGRTCFSELQLLTAGDG